MNSNFIQQIINLRDSYAPVAANFGVVQIQGLFIHRKTNNGVVVERITPDPYVNDAQLELRSFEDLQSFQGMVRVINVKGISKKYARSDLESEFIEFYTADGKRCRLVTITENTITWDLQLEQRIGEQDLYG